MRVHHNVKVHGVGYSGKALKSPLNLTTDNSTHFKENILSRIMAGVSYW